MWEGIKRKDVLKHKKEIEQEIKNQNKVRLPDQLNLHFHKKESRQKAGIIKKSLKKIFNLRQTKPSVFSDYEYYYGENAINILYETYRLFYPAVLLEHHPFEYSYNTIKQGVDNHIQKFQDKHSEIIKKTEQLHKEYKDEREKQIRKKYDTSITFPFIK